MLFRSYIKNPWTGSVTIADPLTLPQVEIIEDAIDIKPDGEKVYLTVFDKKNLPAVFACVEKWDLENFPDPVTDNNFPMSPRGASHDLISWIWSEIIKIYIGEQEVPNE